MIKTADTPTFRFRCSYRNMVEYNVWNSPDSSCIEEYYPLGWLEESEKRNHNGDADSYQRNVVDRIGGVVNHSGSYRMTYSLWQAYVTWKVQQHREFIKQIKAHPEQYGDYTPEPVQIPKPLYWNQELNRYAVEPWYTGENN